MSYIYSVLTCIFGDYENIREVVNPNPLVEYILVTDNEELSSNTWTIVHDNFLREYSSYSTSFYVRSHPFEYISTDTVLWIDGSVQILDDCTSELMLPFIYGEQEIVEVLNVMTDSPVEEVRRWGEYGFHGYTREHADRIVRFFEKENFQNGLVQNTIFACKNTKLTRRLNSMWWELILRYGEYPEVDHQSMSLRSYCLWKEAYRSSKLLLLSPTTLWCHYFDYRFHGTDISQYDSFKDHVFIANKAFPYDWVYKFHDHFIQPVVLKMRDDLCL